MKRFRTETTLWLCAALLLTLTPVPVYPCHVSEDLRAVQGMLTPSQVEMLSQTHSKLGKIPYELEAAAPCVGGTADIFPCQNVDLLAHVPLDAIGGGNGNDMWGWTDPATGVDYALVGRSNGTAFLDISDPENPVYIGNLPRESPFSTPWRDIKVYQDHAFVVQDAAPNAGVQIFDLTRLRSVINPPVEFVPDEVYDGIGFAHNIAINVETGYAYALGSNKCSGGLHMIDISSPQSPSFAGCYSDDGYTHDAECLSYTGPDPDYQGREVCFAFNEDTLTLVDVTNKSSPSMIARKSYAGVAYTHQGSVSEDQRYVLMDDELDESSNGHNARTYIWDVSDLDNPVLTARHTGGDGTDHNQYVHGNYSYQAHYRLGLRVLDLSGVADGNVSEVAFFDTFPDGDGKSFDGAWSTYPYFGDGLVLVSDINRGLFILRVNLATLDAVGSCPGDATITIEGVTPGATIGLAGSLEQGPFTVPGGSCQGVTLGLEDPRPITTVTADGDGRAVFTQNLPAGACGGFAQAVDFSTCSPTNVEQLPE